MNNIKKEYRDILIAILIVGIISMTIVYANFTRRLQIISLAKVNNTNWDIHFENLVKNTSQTTDSVKINSEPSISEGKTIISGFDADFSKPGDKVTYTFDIVNSGDLDAKLYNFVKSTPVCEPSNAICESIIYTLKYTDGSQIKNSDTLNVNERKNVTMTIGIDNNASSVPSELIQISNINAVFDYVQN